MKNVAVIGAGITGITTAYYLAKRGNKVMVFDKHRYSGMQTSYANGGQLSVSNSEVWTTWPNVIKGLKWMFTKDAPLLVNPTPSFDKFKWIAEFLYHTAAGSYEKNTIMTIKLGIAARQLYYQIAEEEGIEFDLCKRGILHFYKDAEYFNAAKVACKGVYAATGVRREVITFDEIKKIEPSLSEAKGIVGGTYTPEDANGDIHKFCIGLSKVLREKYDVNFMYDTEVNALDVADIFDHVVICSGVDSAKISRQIGDPLNIYPVKGYSITINDVGNSAPQVSLLDDQAKIVSSRLGNRFRVAGTAELNGENYDIVAGRIDPLVRWVRQNFPKVSTENVVPWAGLRPMTPSMVPDVRRSKVPNIWYNTGHGHLGWTLSAATADFISFQINRV